MKTRNFLFTVVLLVAQIAFSQDPTPLMKDPEFLRMYTTDKGRSIIELDIFASNAITLEVACIDVQTKKIISIPENIITFDPVPTLEKPYRATLTLPDPKKGYMYVLVARNSNNIKSNTVSWNYQPQTVNLTGDITYEVKDKKNLKVTWNLTSNSALPAYGYNLKILNGDYSRNIRGQFVNLSGSIFFENVFKPGENYKVNFEVGMNEFATAPVKSDQEVKIESIKPLDFEPTASPAIIFFNDGTKSGIKVKFQTTKPCQATVKINQAGNINLFVVQGNPTKTDKHEILITDALNFVSNENESVAYLEITLQEFDSEGKPIVTEIAKTARIGIGGSKSSNVAKIDMDKKEKAIETSKKIGQVLGVGLKGLVSTFLPIP